MSPQPPLPGQDIIHNLFPPYLVYTLLIILAIALIFYWLTGNEKNKETPVEVLKRRYAAGEIDKETFMKMKEDLLGEDPGGT